MMWRWIEEDKKGVEVMGIRVNRRTSAGEGGEGGVLLVIYMKSAVAIGKLGISRKLFNTTRYGCDRICKADIGAVGWIPMLI